MGDIPQSGGWRLARLFAWRVSIEETDGHFAAGIEDPNEMLRREVSIDTVSDCIRMLRPQADGLESNIRQSNTAKADGSSRLFDRTTK
jgi:hypothetical protein